MADPRGVPAADAETCRKLGDHLFLKEDYDGALAQYCAGVRAKAGATGAGWVEPSHVIRQFLKVAQVRNLAIYLEELHDATLATTEHTTLLLSCYAQLKVSSGKVYDSIQKSVAAEESSDVSDLIEEWLNTEAADEKSDKPTTIESENALTKLLSDASLATEVDDRTVSPASTIVALRTMARTSDENFSSVKDYLARALVDETRHLGSSHKKIHSLKRDLQKSHNRLQELQRTSHIFQSNRCFRCTQTLDLPAVHFFCMHNYHEACNEGFCRKCS